MRILLVEDTEDLAEAIVRRVRRSGHAIDWEADGTQADDILRVQRYDLVVLDITLPGRSGFDILKGLRRRSDSTPVLVLTSSEGRRVGKVYVRWCRIRWSPFH